MNRWPAPGGWGRQAVGFLLLLAFLPFLLDAAVEAVNGIVRPLLPYLVVGVILVGLWRALAWWWRRDW